MRVLVVGGGGREHALVWRLARSPSVKSVACAPGNGGIAAEAVTFAVAAEDTEGVVSLAVRERFDLVVVGPEVPLARGLADRLTAAAVPVFGCSAAAAEVESSKAFAKALMSRAGVPTARHGVFTDAAEAARFVDEVAAAGAGRLVVKADGLAAGKGVVICDDAAAARHVVRQMIAGELVGRAGARIVIEEFLVGREASCMALVDGERYWLLDACEDHKAVGDGDTGPMTGGMGAISPTPVVNDALAQKVGREVFQPVARTLQAEGRPFRGLLYAGLMVTADGPKVLEFNCRFGDPETQPLLARFEGDLGETLLAIAAGSAPEPPRFSRRAACCVVMVARGYPGDPTRGTPIEGLDRASALDDVKVFHGGTRRVDGRLLTSGGRVLGVTALGDDLAAARRRAYEAVALIHFDGAHYRRDIGGRGGSSEGLGPAQPA